MKKENENVAPYCYYSKLLNKPFDTLEDLTKAEDEYTKAHEAELKAKEEKRIDAKKVEDAYKDYLAASEKARKEVDEAHKAYITERQKFIEKYGSYHQSYYNDGKREILSVSDLVDEVFNNFPMLPFNW